MSMEKTRSVGVLHPGLMGVSVANALLEAANRVCWASENRSDETMQRANKLQLEDCNTLSSLCEECAVIFSVCPPAEALNLAQATVDGKFKGMFVDCNAVAPATGLAIADLLNQSGVEYVDGGIIGPPAWSQGTTRLYLSGTHAGEVAELFKGSLMATVDLGESPVAASAMKMAYAAWTKGSAALLLSVFALAEHHGLGESLEKEWDLSQPGLKKKLDGVALGNAPKGWRFVGEMQQIAQTLDDAGQNPGAFESAAAIYQAMAGFKSSDAADISTETVIRSILDASASATSSQTAKDKSS